ncbi:hypothetical protein ACI65C_001649 [Semiaphis heraclei]
MCHLPVLWLPLALTVLITNRCAIGLSTRSQLQQLIDIILFEDKLYDDVLSEKLKLENDDSIPFPLRASEKLMIDLNDVDPMAWLLALNRPHPHRSGENLNLSLTIVGKSLTCLTYKRVAIHLALIIGLIENNIEHQGQYKMRSRMFAYVIPSYMDMLSSINRNFENLLNVYDTVHAIFSSPDAEGGANNDENVKKLTELLTSLNEVIESSCAVSDMKEYCSSLKLKKLKKCEEKITDENKISLNMKADTIIKTLKENENAILNYFDEMSSLRNMDMSTWRVLMNTPDLPSGSDEKEFVRKPLPLHPYRYEVEAIFKEIDIPNEKDPEDSDADKSDVSNKVQAEEGTSSTTTLDEDSKASSTQPELSGEEPQP